MDAYVKVAGTWKTTKNIYVKVAGVWKPVKKAYVKVAGVWKQFYNAWELLFSGTFSNTGTNFGADATAEVVFRTDGTIDMRDNLTGPYTEVGAWITDPAGPGEAASSGAELRWTNAVGDPMTGFTTPQGTWHDITASDLQLFITDTNGSGGVNQSVIFDMEVRNAANVTQDIQEYELLANRTDA